MPLDLYYLPDSSPCRAVQLTAKALGLQLNLIKVDLFKDEHLTPEYEKLNIQKVIPTLVDDGFALGESRAIIRYLANKYGKGTNLYPEEPKARALVDHRLDFDIGTLYLAYSDYYYPYIFYTGVDDQEKRAKIDKGLVILDRLLEGQKYVAGPNYTIADISLYCGVSGFEPSGIDVSQYKNVTRWLNTIRTTAPGGEEDYQDGIEAFRALVKVFMAKKTQAQKIKLFNK